MRNLDEDDGPTQPRIDADERGRWSSVLTPMSFHGRPSSTCFITCPRYSQSTGMQQSQPGCRFRNPNSVSVSFQGAVGGDFEFGADGGVGCVSRRLQSVGGVFYLSAQAGDFSDLRFQLRAVDRRGSDSAETFREPRRESPTWSCCACVSHGVVAVLLALVSSGVVSSWVMLACAPVLLRALVGIVRLEPVLRIKRLGWTEVA